MGVNHSKNNNSNQPQHINQDHSIYNSQHNPQYNSHRQPPRVLSDNSIKKRNYLQKKIKSISFSSFKSPPFSPNLNNTNNNDNNNNNTSKYNGKENLSENSSDNDEYEYDVDYDEEGEEEEEEEEEIIDDTLDDDAFLPNIANSYTIKTMKIKLKTNQKQGIIQNSGNSNWYLQKNKNDCQDEDEYHLLNNKGNDKRLRVVSINDIIHILESQIVKTSEILGTSMICSSTLLLHFKWNIDLLLQTFVEKGEYYVFNESGVQLMYNNDDNNNKINLVDQKSEFLKLLSPISKLNRYDDDNRGNNTTRSLQIQTPLQPNSLLPTLPSTSSNVNRQEPTPQPRVRWDNIQIPANTNTRPRTHHMNSITIAPPLVINNNINGNNNNNNNNNNYSLNSIPPESPSSSIPTSSDSSPTSFSNNKTTTRNDPNDSIEYILYTLVSIFPNIDPDEITRVLKAENYSHLRTCEFLLNRTLNQIYNEGGVPPISPEPQSTTIPESNSNKFSPNTSEENDTTTNTSTTTTNTTIVEDKTKLKNEDDEDTSLNEKYNKMNDISNSFESITTRDDFYYDEESDDEHVNNSNSDDNGSSNSINKKNENIKQSNNFLSTPTNKRVGIRSYDISNPPPSPRPIRRLTFVTKLRKDNNDLSNKPVKQSESTESRNQNQIKLDISEDNNSSSNNNETTITNNNNSNNNTTVTTTVNNNNNCPMSLSSDNSFLCNTEEIDKTNSTFTFNNEISSEESENENSFPTPPRLNRSSTNNNSNNNNLLNSNNNVNNNQIKSNSNNNNDNNQEDSTETEKDGADQPISSLDGTGLNNDNADIGSNKEELTITDNVNYKKVEEEQVTETESDLLLISKNIDIKEEKDGEEETEAKTICNVCFCDVVLSKAYGLQCKHYYCLDCWVYYLVTKIDEGPSSCLYTKCIDPSCKFILNLVDFRNLLSNEKRLYDKFINIYVKSFIEFNPNTKWCTNPLSCNMAIHYSGIDLPNIINVSCSCNWRFCFHCGEEYHTPSTCVQVSDWRLLKSKEEGQNAIWLSHNTKKCPKCKIHIEKNEGCAHLICLNCKYEWCWLCKGPWSEHGDRTGGYFSCNRYDPLKHDSYDLDKTFGTYVHHFQRFNYHGNAKKFAMCKFDTFQKQDSRLKKLKISDNLKSHFQLAKQFLSDALNLILDCRHSLKYTYVYGYYLKENTCEKELFDFLQEDLEKSTEHLVEIIFAEVDKLINFITRFKNNTTTSNKNNNHFNNLTESSSSSENDSATSSSKQEENEEKDCYIFDTVQFYHAQKYYKVTKSFLENLTTGIHYGLTSSYAPPSNPPRSKKHVKGTLSLLKRKLTFPKIN